MAAGLIDSLGAPQPEEIAAVLVVSPFEDDHDSLRSVLSRSNYRVHRARNCREALAFLHDNPMPVLICERCLPDGNWKDIWNAICTTVHPPRVIVSSLQADDRLWAEVLNLGAHDVLTKPFDPKEVSRVAFLAWRHWKDDRERTDQKGKEPKRAGSSHG